MTSRGLVNTVINYCLYSCANNIMRVNESMSMFQTAITGLAKVDTINCQPLVIAESILKLPVLYEFDNIAFNRNQYVPSGK